MKKNSTIKILSVSVLLSIFLLICSTPLLALNRKRGKGNEFSHPGAVIGPKQKIKKIKNPFKPKAVKAYKKRRKAGRKANKKFMKKMLKQKPPKQKMKKKRKY